MRASRTKKATSANMVRWVSCLGSWMLPTVGWVSWHGGKRFEWCELWVRVTSAWKLRCCWTVRVYADWKRASLSSEHTPTRRGGWHLCCANTILRGSHQMDSKILLVRQTDNFTRQICALKKLTLCAQQPLTRRILPRLITVKKWKIIGK